MLKLATQQQIKNCLSTDFFVTFCQDACVPTPFIPQYKIDTHVFNDVVDELSFVTAYTGWLAAQSFSSAFPQIVKDLSFNNQYTNIENACSNLYFLNSAKELKVPTPIRSISGEFLFKDEMDKAAFVSFYAGWIGYLNFNN